MVAVVSIAEAHSEDNLKAMDDMIVTKKATKKRISDKPINITPEEFKVLVDENHTMRNLNPRGAYIHRLSEVGNFFFFFLSQSLSNQI